MRFPLLLAALALLVSLPATAKVQLHRDGQGRWQLLRDGEPFEIKGVGRQTDMDLAAAIGANTVRTYSSPLDPEGKARAFQLMDEARAKGLCYIRGLYLQREGRDGFSYSDPEKLATQRDLIRATVRAYREHPAILLWGLGNEAEGPRTKETHPEFWKELDVLARIIKEEDPTRPVMTVIAGTSAWRIQAVRDYYPSIDILGVNTYGGAPSLPFRLDAAGWDKPYVLTEFGPRGHWEVPKTDWGAPVEPSSESKAELYARGYRGAKNDPKGRFLGAVCFVWAQKQEITSTWYGMFLETGEKTPAVDYMAYVYSGHWPENRSPRILSLTSELDRAKVPPGAEFTAAVEADDAEGDTLAFEWKVIRESGAQWAEGDREPVPPTIPGCIVSAEGNAVTVRTPDRPGAYRLFVYVRDGRRGGAAQNVPFLVAESASPVASSP